MSTVKIQVLDNAPYVVKGDVELLDGEGNVIEKASELHLCRCGKTENTPHCDGSHTKDYKNKVRAKS